MDEPVAISELPDPVLTQVHGLMDVDTSRRWLTRMGLWPSVLLITLVSTIASVLLGMGYHALLAGGLDQMSRSSWVMAVATPIIVAPCVSVGLVHLLIELDKARRLNHRLAVTDGLTGAYNRRFLMDQGQAAVLKARREGQNLSLIILDVDHFKSVNDRFGHSTGDEVLKRLTEVAVTCLRKTDILARFGGEEFVMLLPDTDLGLARQVAERFRQALAVQSIDTLDSPLASKLSVTASLGVACAEAGQLSLDKLLHLADQALYVAKESGRNQTQLAQADKPA